MMNERGFTLAELLIAVALIGMILAGIFAIQQQGQTAYLLGAGRVEVQQAARIALDRMMAEIRTATSFPADVTSCDNDTTGTTDITFVAQDGTTTLRYMLSGTSLARLVGSDTTVDQDDIVIGGVQALRIKCYKANGTTLTADKDDIRTIWIQISTRGEVVVPSTSPMAQNAVAEGRVRLRNVL